MQASNKLILEQTQSQRLIPLQVRVGRLLEMNSLEIEQEVRRALEELPALTVEESGVDSDKNAELTANDFNETAEQVQMADYKPDDLPETRGWKAESRNWENYNTEPEQTLADALESQLKELELTDKDYEIARYIIGSIDSNGYMARTMSAISDDIRIQTGIDVSVDETRKVWKIIRSFDPPGVGAVDLRDALLLQLKRKEETQAVCDATEIISDYFDLFSLKHFRKIETQTGMSRARLREAMGVIRQLNPKPGSIHASSALEENSRHIIPDFRVDVEDGNITLTLLNDLPALTIEQTFTDDSSILATASARAKKETATFLKTRRDEAKEFISLLQARQQTLFRVMSAIIKLQKDFFLTDDVAAIKPMILKDVSAITGDDLSVISRTAANKYVSTARGIYPLKIFFNERTKIGGDHKSTSRREIASFLSEIINNEDKHSPLADEAIVEIMKKKNIDIARRTVAKYREQLGIPVARLRKEF